MVRVARMHLHLVPTRNHELWTVEIHQGNKSWTIGRLSRTSASSWSTLAPAAGSWTPCRPTRRAAVDDLLARAALERAGARSTVLDTVSTGEVVTYWGSHAYWSGAAFVVGPGRDHSAGYPGYELLDEHGDVVLRRARRASISRTGRSHPICSCGHLVGGHLTEAPVGHTTCMTTPCRCEHVYSTQDRDAARATLRAA